MNKNKCEICGKEPAYKTLKGNTFCIEHFIKWVVKTVIVAGILILIYKFI